MRLIDQVRHGSKVTIISPHGNKQIGKAVMKSICGGWVLNLGGRYGTPAIATDENTIAVK